MSNLSPPGSPGPQYGRTPTPIDGVYEQLAAAAATTSCFQTFSLMTEPDRVKCGFPNGISVSDDVCGVPAFDCYGFLCRALHASSANSPTPAVAAFAASYGFTSKQFLALISEIFVLRALDRFCRRHAGTYVTGRAFAVAMCFELFGQSFATRLADHMDDVWPFMSEHIEPFTSSPETESLLFLYKNPRTRKHYIVLSVPGKTTVYSDLKSAPVECIVSAQCFIDWIIRTVESLKNSATEFPYAFSCTSGPQVPFRLVDPDGYHAPNTTQVSNFLSAFVSATAPFVDPDPIQRVRIQSATEPAVLVPYLVDDTTLKRKRPNSPTVAGTSPPPTSPRSQRSRTHTRSPSRSPSRSPGRSPSPAPAIVPTY